MYAPQHSLKISNQKLSELEGEIDQSTIMLGDCSILLLVINTTRRQKISNDNRGLEHKQPT